MSKLLKYLKKFTVPIIVVALLLFGQVMLDLALPDYTSRIVNVGIQQGGITETAPKVIREKQMDLLFLFVNETDQKTILKSYRHLQKDKLEEQEKTVLTQKYPVLSTENLYLLDTSDQKVQEELGSILAKPMLMVSYLAGDSEQSIAMKQKILEQFPEHMRNQNIFVLLASMPQESREQMMAKMLESMSGMPDSMLDQVATSFVKSEYSAIGMDTGKIQTDYIIMAGLKMLGISFLSMVVAVLVGYLGSIIAAKLAKMLREQVFKKVVGFSNSEFKNFSTASLITRSTNDITQIQQLIVMLLRVVFYAPIMAVGGILKVVNTNTSMTWIIIVAVAAIITVVLVLFGTVMPKFKRVQKCVDRLNLVTREILTGLPVIRAFSRSKHEEKRFDDANQDLSKTNLFVNRVMSAMMPAMMFIMNAVMLLIVWNGAHGIDSGMMQVGDMMAFIQYTMQIIMSFLMISMVSIILPRASVSAARIDEILSTKEVITDPEKPKSFDPTKKGLVEFKDVSFRYPDASYDVITGINFTAEPGKTTAFIGSTGSGKSTVINLIPRFFDVSDGRILIDGVDIRDVKQHDLRAKIGYVPQKGILFSGTIDSNVRYGKKDATENEIKEAISIAQANEFVSKMPAGLESPIAQGGNNVSGGQKQRLSIARAIAVKPDVYIFDDSFSALDFKTDATLRSALKKVTKESTVLIVAQRVSTIMHADQIIVLDEGKIVGIGTHQQLLEDCDVYKQIASSQLSKEELANG